MALPGSATLALSPATPLESVFDEPSQNPYDHMPRAPNRCDLNNPRWNEKQLLFDHLILDISDNGDSCENNDMTVDRRNDHCFVPLFPELITNHTHSMSHNKEGRKSLSIKNLSSSSSSIIGVQLIAMRKSTISRKRRDDEQSSTDSFRNEERRLIGTEAVVGTSLVSSDETKEESSSPKPLSPSFSSAFSDIRRRSRNDDDATRLDANAAAAALPGILQGITLGNQVELQGSGEKRRFCR